MRPRRDFIDLPAGEPERIKEQIDRRRLVESMGLVQATRCLSGGAPIGVSPWPERSLVHERVKLSGSARQEELFIGVPYVGRELPIAARFAPDDGIFPDDFLRGLALCLEADGTDFAGRLRA
jgi:hypothetical protein